MRKYYYTIRLTDNNTRSNWIFAYNAIGFWSTIHNEWASRVNDIKSITLDRIE